MYFNVNLKCFLNKKVHLLVSELYKEYYYLTIL